jgi:hypothetical protein
MLVVRPQQTDSGPPHAGVPEVAKRTRDNALEAKRQKRRDHQKMRLEGLRNSV